MPGTKLGGGTAEVAASAIDLAVRADGSGSGGWSKLSKFQKRLTARYSSGATQILLAMSAKAVPRASIVAAVHSTVSSFVKYSFR